MVVDNLHVPRIACSTTYGLSLRVPPGRAQSLQVPAPLEQSTASLTCAVTSRLDAVMVGAPTLTVP